MKPIIRVFPDYMASGLWEYPYGREIDFSEVVDVIPKHLLIALRWWVWSWERFHDYTTGEDHISDDWYNQWEFDGKHLVETMNTRAIQDTLQHDI